MLEFGTRTTLPALHLMTLKGVGDSGGDLWRPWSGGGPQDRGIWLGLCSGGRGEPKTATLHRRGGGGAVGSAERIHLFCSTVGEKAAEKLNVFCVTCVSLESLCVCEEVCVQKRESVHVKCGYQHA